MQEKKSMGGSLLILLICIIGSFLLVSFFIPKLIDWVESPFMPQGVSCAPTIQWAIRKLLLFQTGSVIFGALLGVFIIFKFRKPSKLI